MESRTSAGINACATLGMDGAAYSPDGNTNIEAQTHIVLDISPQTFYVQLFAN